MLRLEKMKLMAALEAVVHVVPSRSSIPSLSFIRIQATESECVVSGTDLDLGIEYRVSGVASDSDIDVCVPARRFFEVIKESPSGIIELQNGKTLQLKISAGNGFRASLEAAPVAEFPALPGVEGPVHQIPQENIRYIFEKTSFAVSTDSSRLALNGVFVEQNGSDIEATATDCKEFAHAYNYLGDERAIPEGGIIVPPGAISLVQKHAPRGDAMVGLNVSTSKTTAVFQCGDVKIFTKLFEGPYPNWHRVVPAASAHVATVDSAELLGCLRRVSVLAMEGKSVRATFSEGRIKIETENSPFGEASDSVPAEYDGETFEIGMNAKSVSEIIRICNDPKIIIAMNGPLNAIKFRGYEDNPVYWISMPMRIAGVD